MSNDLIDKVKSDRFAAYIGIKLIEARPGFAAAELELQEKHLNGVNIAHGGVLFTLADFAFAVASNSGGFATVAINVNISYYQSPRGKLLKAEASEIITRKRICGYNVDVFDEDGSLIARFTGLGYRKV